MDRHVLPNQVFHFEAVGDIVHLQEFGNFDFIDYSSATQKLIGSDGHHIISIEPGNASHRILHRTENLLEISCIHPTTGDIIFIVPDASEMLWDTFKLKADTGDVCEFHVPTMDGEPHPTRIIELENGERIFLGPVDYDGDTRIGCIHTDSSGRCLYWNYDMPSFEQHFESGDGLAWPFAKVNHEAMFTTNGYGIYAWYFETHETTLIAGAEKVGGCKDGIGRNARFWRMRNPVVNRRHLFVRSEGPRMSQWRQVCVDLQTMSAQTVRFIGIDHDDFIAYCVTDQDIFVLQSVSSSAKQFQLFRAPLTPAADPVKPSFPLKDVDLEAPVRPIVFRLAGGVALQVDGRLLMARSEYFRDMLTSGLQEDASSEVDLTRCADVDANSLSMLLRHVLGDPWDDSQTDAELVFRVRALADRYRLPRLVNSAEAHLTRLLNLSNVLMFLSRVVGSGSGLEDSCWALIESDREGILKANQGAVRSIIAQNPELAERLILWQTGAELDPAARPNKRNRA